MISKEYPISPPWPVDLAVRVFGKPAEAKGTLKDEKVVILDKLISKLYREALQIRAGTYTGNSSTALANSQTITAGIKPQLVIILRNIDLGVYTTTVTGQMGIATILNEGATFITGVGYVNNGVTAFTQDGFTVGSNSNLNNDNVSYLYVVVG